MYKKIKVTCPCGAFIEYEISLKEKPGVDDMKDRIAEFYSLHMGCVPLNRIQVIDLTDSKEE